ncbi:MAG TPA: hypothetical protein VKG02_12730 [Blastocatellia bacterium]|nr:hypothetical protein [Blastocatellia bacterium]
MNRMEFIDAGLVSGVRAVAASNVALAGANGAEPAHKFKKDNKTKEGGIACIQAYVCCDNFEIDGQ